MFADKCREREREREGERERERVRECVSLFMYVCMYVCMYVVTAADTPLTAIVIPVLNDSWPHTDDSLWETKPTAAYTSVYIYCVINSIACCMFRPTIVAIFRAVFFEWYVTQSVRTVCKCEM